MLTNYLNEVLQFDTVCCIRLITNITNNFSCNMKIIKQYVHQNYISFHKIVFAFKFDIFHLYQNDCLNGFSK